MRRSTFIFLLLAVLAGCRENANVADFWNTHSIDYSDIDAAQDQFARYAEQAVAAEKTDALASMDVLFDRLKEDEVGYYVYTDWIDGVFYNPLPRRRSLWQGRRSDRHRRYPIQERIRPLRAESQMDRLQPGRRIRHRPRSRTGWQAHAGTPAGPRLSVLPRGAHRSRRETRMGRCPPRGRRLRTRTGPRCPRLGLLLSGGRYRRFRPEPDAHVFRDFRRRRGGIDL